MPHVGYRRPILHTALAVLAATALSACDVAINSMGGGLASASQVWTRTYTLAGSGTQVEIVNTSGAITVEAVDGNTLDIKATIRMKGATEEAARDLLKQVEIVAEAGAAKVRIETKYPRSLGRQSPDVTYAIRVPKTAKVDLRAVNGTITVSGMQAGVHAEISNGEIRGQNLAGPVSASTTNGGIHLQVSSVEGEGLTLETTNGSIDLKLPAQTKATLAARCVNGRINVSNLPFEKDGEGSRRRLNGTINGGGPEIRIDMINGSIRVGRL